MYSKCNFIFISFYVRNNKTNALWGKLKFNKKKKKTFPKLYLLKLDIVALCFTLIWCNDVCLLSVPIFNVTDEVDNHGPNKNRFLFCLIFFLFFKFESMLYGVIYSGADLS